MLLHDHQMAWVVLAVVAMAVAKPIYNLAHYNLAPRLAPGELLLQYNGFRGSVIQAGWLVGLPLSGLLMMWRGPVAALAFTGVIYGGASTVTALVRKLPGPSVKPTPTAPCQWRDVTKTLIRERELWVHLVLTSGDFVLVALVNVALVPLVVARLHNHVYWLPVLDGSFTLGSLFVGPAVSRIVKRFGYRVGALLGLGTEALLFAGMALMRAPIGIVLILVILGASSTLSVMSLMTTLQKRSPAPVRARIAGIRGMGVALISAGLIPIATAVEARAVSGASLFPPR